MIDEIQSFHDLPKSGIFFIVIYRDWCWKSFQFMSNILTETRQFQVFLLNVDRLESYESTPTLLLMKDGVIVEALDEFNVLETTTLSTIWGRHVPRNNWYDCLKSLLRL